MPFSYSKSLINSFNIFLYLSFSCCYAASDTETNTNTTLSPKVSDSLNAGSNNFYRAPWGVAIGIRRAVIPFKTDNKVISDVIPLIQYRNDYLFINGLKAGIHLWKQQAHEINLYSRFRFEDLPKDLQNKTQSDGFDYGLQYRHTKGQWQNEVVIMTTDDYRYYSFGEVTYQWHQGDWQLEPYAKATWKSRGFNEKYYGLEQYSVSAGTSISGGINAKYHIASNLYLLGRFGFNRLGDNIAKLPNIDSQYQYETFFGFGFYPGEKNQSQNELSFLDINGDTGQFIRVSHGWATPSNLGDILALSTRSDQHDNQMTSVSYGVRLTDQLFNLPIELYFTPGANWHQKSSVQDPSYEFFGSIKAYYTFELGSRCRFGIGEGLSYVTKLTYIEQAEMNEKGYRGSKLLNYLDFSLDTNIGDLLHKPSLKQLWLGYGIHHRSGIFEASSAFGRIKGGSNYQTIYLQWQF